MENQIKTVYYANFNITFGKENEPMLNHFIDIIYPAFQAGFIRGNKEEKPNFYFTNVKLTEIDNDIVLVGNYIKDDKISVYTTVHAQQLVASPNEVETAPYSRFIVFLRNHRMVLVKNESNSPDIRSFQSTVRMFLKRYVRSENKKKTVIQKLPLPNINIVAIPLQEDVFSAFKSVKKILFLNFRFFPLNNDLNPYAMEQNINQMMQDIDCKTANMRFNSPKSKAQVAGIMTRSQGLAEVTARVENGDGTKSSITNSKIRSNKKINYNGNLQEKDDAYIISLVKNSPAISIVSKENDSLYNRVKAQLAEFIKSIMN